jgi:hypothetical protein
MTNKEADLPRYLRTTHSCALTSEVRIYHHVDNVATYSFPIHIISWLINKKTRKELPVRWPIACLHFGTTTP